MTLIGVIRSQISLVESLERRKAVWPCSAARRAAYISTTCHRIALLFVASPLFAYSDWLPVRGCSVDVQENRDCRLAHAQPARRQLVRAGRRTERGDQRLCIARAPPCGYVRASEAGRHSGYCGCALLYRRNETDSRCCGKGKSATQPGAGCFRNTSLSGDF